MKRRRCAILLVLLVLLCTCTGSLLASDQDNATSGSGEIGNAVEGKGFYLAKHYAWKVSLFVGKSDQATTSSDLRKDFYYIGGQPIVLKPSTYGWPTTTTLRTMTKLDILSGNSEGKVMNPYTPSQSPPPPPIVSGGDIERVKAYFGDTVTLEYCLIKLAESKGVTIPQLFTGLTFTVAGETKPLAASDLYPYPTQGQPRANLVPWVIVYEPIAIGYLSDGKKVAYTASEYAWAQILKQYNFGAGQGGQYIKSMTHGDLPNSVLLQESWFGFSAPGPKPDKVRWSDLEIIKAGGWGMRFLLPGKTLEKPPEQPKPAPEAPQPETPKQPVLPPVGPNLIADPKEYRVDTEVITSLKTFSHCDIANDNKAQVKFTTSTGQSSTMTLVLPNNRDQLAWIKWRTPKTEGTVTITATISGNSGLRFSNGSRTAIITATVVDWNAKVPPDPKAVDAKPTNYTIPALPKKPQMLSTSWHVWNCRWIEHWVDRGSWYTDAEGQEHWDSHYVDEGWWEWNQIIYGANLWASLALKPDDKVPTARKLGNNQWEMKSAYGINVLVKTGIAYSCPVDQITPVQNVITLFPEFNYKTYARLLDPKYIGDRSAFEFRKNKYSTYNNRVHFTPLWFPDGKYTPVLQIFDAWTPVGMMTSSLSDTIMINGNVYDDWIIGPADGKPEGYR